MTPSSGRDEWAARPKSSTSTTAKPRCATARSSHVGSPTRQASGSPSRSRRAAITASVPALASSSSADSTRVTAATRAVRRAGVEAGRPRLGGADHRGDTGLHVAGAAAVHPSGPPVTHDGRGERVGHPTDADRVEMTVEQQRDRSAVAVADRCALGRGPPPGWAGRPDPAGGSARTGSPPRSTAASGARRPPPPRPRRAPGPGSPCRAARAPRSGRRRRRPRPRQRGWSRPRC